MKNKKILKLLLIILAVLAIIVWNVGVLTLTSLPSFSSVCGWLGIMLGFAAVILAVNMQKGKHRKIITTVLVCFMALISVIHFWGGDILNALSPDPVIYELSEKEKEWLKIGCSSKADEERIEEGRLWSYERNKLEQGRAGMEYLEEKYPGYEFKITYFESMINLQTFSVREETTDYLFSMYIWENEDDTFRIEDNFYAYFFEDKYGAYLEEKIKTEVDTVVKVNAHMSGVKGREYDSGMTVEDILSGQLEVYVTNNVLIAAKDLTEEECRTNVETVCKSIEKAGLFGIYNIYFWNMTEEEMLLTETYEGLTYKYIFKFFDNVEENK